MKNKVFVLSLLVPLLLLSGCNSNLSYVKKRLKNADYSFKIDTQPKRRSSKLNKRNKLQPKSSVIHPDIHMLEIDFEEQVDIDDFDFFQSFNDQLSIMSIWAKNHALNLVEQTKQLEKEAKEKRTEPPKTSSIVYYNDETKEISTFTKMLSSYVSIHLYNDEDGDEVVEYTTYNTQTKRFENVKHSPGKQCDYIVGETENDKLLTMVIKTQKINGEWIGIEYSHRDGDYPHGEYKDGYHEYFYAGASILFQINGYDYRLTSAFDWKDKTHLEPTDDELYEYNPILESKYGTMATFENGNFGFLFRATAFDGINKEFIDTKSAEFIKNSNNCNYSVQTIKDLVLKEDRSYLLTNNGNEIHSTFVFDTVAKEYIEEENENTIVGNQSTIGVAKGELYEGTFEDYAIIQHDTYIDFGDNNLEKGRSKLDTFFEFNGLTVAEGLNQNFIYDLFEAFADPHKYEDAVTNYFFGNDYNYANLRKLHEQTNEDVHQQIENIQKFAIS